MRLLLVLLLLAACESPAPEAEEATPEERIVPVAVAPARTGLVADPVLGTGTIVPSRAVVVSAEGSGRVLKVSVKLGDRVERGQIIARLDAEIQGAQLEQARANQRAAAAMQALAQARANRADTLLPQGATTPSEQFAASQDLAAATAQADGAAAAVTLAERAAADAAVRAPYGGRVAQVMLDEGALIGPGTPAFRLVDLDPITVRLGVPARDVALVRAGQPATVEVTSLPGERYLGEVSHVGPEADASSRTYPVEINLPNPDGALRSGMVARVEVIVGEREGAVLVPESAIVAERPPIMFVVQDGVAQRREVTLGRIADGEVEVRAGVAAGEQVATLGRQHLSDGTRVSVYTLGDAPESTAGR